MSECPQTPNSKCETTSAKKDVRVVSVEGLIGCGKSTFLARAPKLFRKFNIKTVPEPVEKWSCTLELFYEDKQRWALTSQTNVFLTRVKAVNDAITQCDSSLQYILTERCIHSDKLFFAKMLYDSGLMNEAEWTVYNRLWESVSQAAATDCTRLDAIIYLRSDVETCMHRVSTRNRQSERNLDSTYQTCLMEHHDRYLGVSDTCNNYDQDTPVKQHRSWKTQTTHVVSGKRIPVLVVDVGKRGFNVMCDSSDEENCDTSECFNADSVFLDTISSVEDFLRLLK